MAKKKQSLIDMCTWVAEESMLFGPDAPFEAHVREVANPRVVLVVGDNASGKSLYLQVVATIARKDKVVPVTVSIRERTGAGLYEMAGMRRIMMFGDESENSTGATSVKTVVTSFKNLDKPEGSLLGLDEPEIGLDNGYTRALGEFIGQSTAELPRTCRGVVVVTHSRALIAGMLEGLANVGKVPPSFVVVGDHPAKTLTQWVTNPTHRSVEDLHALPELGFERWRATSKILEEARKR